MTAQTSAAPGGALVKEEPIVRIGVVLAEDNKQTIEAVAPSTGYTVESDHGGALEIDPGATLRIQGDGDRVHAQLGEKGISGNVLTLRAPEGAAPRQAGDGMLVRNVVAGRGFHWQKEIDQTLSDALEFTARGSTLIMVNALPMETYLTGVITGEMSGDCPIEFMKAQATAARSWLLGQKTSPHPGEPFFWCNDDHCQRYQGTGGWTERARQAIEECRGMVLLTEIGEYCDARYSKSTGGISEDASSVWPDEEIDGLDALPDAPDGDRAHDFFPVTEENLEEYLTGDWLKETGCFASPNVVAEDTITKYLGRVDESGTYFRWELTLSHSDLLESLTKRAGIADLARVLDLRPGARGRSGRLQELFVDYETDSGEKKTHRLFKEYHIREGLWRKFLYSSCFIMDFTRYSNGAISELRLRGGGWGHGAGLCQIGALGRALKGQSYEEILLHYYSNVKLESLYQ